MKKRLDQAGLFSVIVLCIGATFILASQGVAQVRQTTKLQIAIKFPLNMTYTRISNYLGILKLQPLFSIPIVVREGSATGTADINTGTVSASYYDDGSNYALVGFYGNGLTNSGSSDITEVGATATIDLKQAVGGVRLFTEIFEDSNWLGSWALDIPSGASGTYTVATPKTLTMKPGRKYAVLGGVSLYRTASPTNTVHALSGRFTTVKFTM